MKRDRHPSPVVRCCCRRRNGRRCMPPFIRRRPPQSSLRPCTRPSTGLLAWEVSWGARVMANRVSRSSGEACVAWRTLPPLGGSSISPNRQQLLGNGKTIVAYALSFLGAALLGITGWLGGELTLRMGIGVDEGANLNAPSSLSGLPASQQGTSAGSLREQAA